MYEPYYPNKTIFHQPKLYDLDTNVPDEIQIDHPDIKLDDEWKKWKKKNEEKGKLLTQKEG